MLFEDCIERNAVLYSDKVAIVSEGQQCTYGDLKKRVAEKVRELKDGPCPKGRIVCVRSFSTLDFLVTYFACHLMGWVVVPLEKDLPDKAFSDIANEMGGYEPPEGVADILYTTGTTGKSKGVMVSHKTIIADAENLIDGLGFSHDLAFVVNGPLNHIGSLSKIYPVLMLGATLILVDGMKDLGKFFQALDYPASKIATFLVPASIRILLQFCAKQLNGYVDKFDFIETGAAAIPQADMETLCKILPHTRLYNTYASTETGIICTYNFNDGKCQAGCVGKPMKHSQVFITETGKIACKGDTLMMGYIGDPERTTTVLKNNTLFTSDYGWIDEQGMLHLKGREDDIINVGGFKVAPTEVEDVALAFPDMEDCVCISVDNVITGKALKLLVVMKPDCTLVKKALALFLKSKLESYKIPLIYQQVDAVHRTFNGKIDRKYYRNCDK